MLQRKDEGKNYSEKNLDIVTRAIAEAKGLDINNPNEMRNIDKPIQQIQIEKRVTDPVITHPTFTGEGRQITPPKISPISYEDDFATTTIKDIIDSGTGKGGGADVWDMPTKPTVEDTAAMEDIITAPPKPTVTYTPPVRHHTGGNGGGRNGGGGKGSSPSDAPGSPFAKGGRIDKALGGRSRYL